MYLNKSHSFAESANRRSLLYSALAMTALALSACGGSSSTPATASVRVVNATLTHPSIDMLVNAGTASAATALDSVSAYSVPASGAATLQVNDAGLATALTTTTSTLTGAAHYALLSYESGATVKSVLLPEDWTVPATGAASLRVYDIVMEAGKLDVFISSNPLSGSGDLAAMSPVGSFAASASTSVLTLTYSPGTYYVTVTAAGNPGDVRMMNMPVILTNQEVASVLLTPASGSQLLNGSLLIQQGAYSAFRNTNTRIRLASAVSGNATVAASASAGASHLSIDGGSVSPQFGSYVLLPQGSALNVSVNGASVAAPATALVAGADMTLLVFGAPGSATASLLTDDNRPPSDATTVKLRLINGISGNANNMLTLTANSATAASAVLPNAVSTYSAVASSLNPMNLSLYSSQKAGVYYANTSYVLNTNSVYTVLAAGDFAAPLLLIR